MVTYVRIKVCERDQYAAKKSWRHLYLLDLTVHSIDGTEPCPGEWLGIVQVER